MAATLTLTILQSVLTFWFSGPLREHQLGACLGVVLPFLLLHLHLDDVVDRLGAEGSKWNGRHFELGEEKTAEGKERQDEEFLE